MPGIMREDSGIESPVLVEWRGNSTKSRGTAAPDRLGYMVFANMPCKSMAKLVEHRGDISKADERRLSWGGLRRFATLKTTGQSAQKP